MLLVEKMLFLFVLVKMLVEENYRYDKKNYDNVSFWKILILGVFFMGMPGIIFLL